jgi:hypothetical protein
MRDRQAAFGSHNCAYNVVRESALITPTRWVPLIYRRHESCFFETDGCGNYFVNQSSRVPATHRQPQPTLYEELEERLQLFLHLRRRRSQFATSYQPRSSRHPTQQNRHFAFVASWENQDPRVRRHKDRTAFSSVRVTKRHVTCPTAGSRDYSNRRSP